MVDQHRKIAYLDCFSGISGDMMLGALLDCGAPEEVLRDNLSLLGLRGWQMDIAPTSSHGLRATGVKVRGDEKDVPRNLADIEEIIQTSRLSEQVRHNSSAVFRTMAEAEAFIHDCPLEDIHFHETGAVDAIIDIVGTTILLEWLQVDRIICSPLPAPSGWVECAHGLLPLPAPATCRILQSTPVYGVNGNTELVTPTGAALAKTLATEFGRLPSMILENTGYGAGSNITADRPNLLRVIIGTDRESREAKSVVVTECNIDDCSPEGFPYLFEKLFDLGALDVTVSPLQMKKGRPGFLLQVISARAHAITLQHCILSETTAIGLRYRDEKRLTLPRRACLVHTRWGKIVAKLVDTPSGPMVYPEYEECARISRRHNVPLKDVFREVSLEKPLRNSEE